MGWQAVPVHRCQRRDAVLEDTAHPHAGAQLLPGPSQFYEARIRELEEAVRGRFFLDLPREGGVSLRSTLEDAGRVSGIQDEQRDVDPIPAGFEAGSRHFVALRQGERITYADVDAYQRVSGI